jgi:hypothetical protein
MGRGCIKAVEPAELVVPRAYAVAWKKQALEVVELARLRREEKLGLRAIAACLCVPRTTVAIACRRMRQKMSLLAWGLPLYLQT